jgi:hypothetical protein
MLNTLLFALRILLSTTAAPAFVDSCDGGYCNTIDTAGYVHTVPRSDLPACAGEGHWTYAGRCLTDDSATIVHAALTSDVSL